MLWNLKRIIEHEAKEGRSAASFNVYGYNDAVGVIQAAAEAQRPVVLMVNKNACRHMPPSIIGPLLAAMAEKSDIPVGIHLDHATEMDTIREAIDSGFTSVMFDGSQLPFGANMDISSNIVAKAHARDVSVEAEIGAVGYSDNTPGIIAKKTDPGEAKRFCKATGIDAVAVAIGTVHRMERQAAKLDFELLKRLNAEINTPLVIHGASGVTDEDLKKLVQYGAKKINIGTAIRMAFGNELRKQFEENPDCFDCVSLYPACAQKVKETVLDKMRYI